MSMHGRIDIGDRIGFLHRDAEEDLPVISSLARLLGGCGLVVVMSGQEENKALERIAEPTQAAALANWIKGNGISRICLSTGVGPSDSLAFFSIFVDSLRQTRSLAADGGMVRSVFFEGDPQSCGRILERFPQVVDVFCGYETAVEVIGILGIPRSKLPDAIVESIEYDENRMAFAREIVGKGDYHSIVPAGKATYSRFGLRGDGIALRVAHGSVAGFLPVIRYSFASFAPPGKEGFHMVLHWAAQLARAGLVDVLSMDGDAAFSPDELSRIWHASRPMLMGPYARTWETEGLGRLIDERADLAWHALSLWPCYGEGGSHPGSLSGYPGWQVAALGHVAAADKPFELDNQRNHTCIGDDDLSEVLSNLVAAKAAKAAGIRRLIMPVDLNSPGCSWGLGDLARARVLLHVVRELEDSDFKVYLQPRACRVFHSKDSEGSKARLAALAALMDDIEPYDSASPQIIHFLSDTRGPILDDPLEIGESARIIRQALADYRALRNSGAVADMSSNSRVIALASQLLRDAHAAIAAIEASIGSPYSPRGLHEMLASGFFSAADGRGSPLPPAEVSDGNPEGERSGAGS